MTSRVMMFVTYFHGKKKDVWKMLQLVNIGKLIVFPALNFFCNFVMFQNKKWRQSLQGKNHIFKYGNNNSKITHQSSFYNFHEFSFSEILLIRCEVFFPLGDFFKNAFQTLNSGHQGIFTDVFHFTSQC